MSTPRNPEPLLLDGENLSLAGLEDVARRGRTIGIASLPRERVARARAVVDGAAARGAVVSGVTTGFGNFADVVIPNDRLRELQLNLVRSPSSGVGEPLGEPETRALMVL